MHMHAYYHIQCEKNRGNTGEYGIDDSPYFPRPVFPYIFNSMYLRSFVRTVVPCFVRSKVFFYLLKTFKITNEGTYVLWI